MIAIDTNRLVYAHRRGTGEHEAARSAIERSFVKLPGLRLVHPL